MNNTELSTALAVATIGTTVYTSFMPPFNKVLNAPATNDNLLQIRSTEVFAGVMVLSLGIALGLITKTKSPFVVAVTVVGGMTIVYETSLRKGTNV